MPFVPGYRDRGSFAGVFLEFQQSADLAADAHGVPVTHLQQVAAIGRLEQEVAEQRLAQRVTAPKAFTRVRTVRGRAPAWVSTSSRISRLGEMLGEITRNSI
ncbi:MAG: hypothetical protein LJE91_16360 [Gammaproteobacteria bacterium]|nr:hypothetical protein [Gammaproteobacteria bacterium]